MSKKTDFAVPDLSAVTMAIANGTANNVTNVEGGVLKGKSEYFESTLPEGMTMEQVRALHEHERRFAIGTALGGGQIAADLMAANEGIQNVTLSFPVARNKVTHTYNRDGKMHSGYTVYGTGGTGGEYKKVADHVSDLVVSRLG